MLNRIYNRAASRLYPRLGARRANFRMAEAIVTFTFDDFPVSALDVGGALLRDYGWRGTYYMSMGLAGTHQTVGEIATADHVDRAVQDGHEVCNHSFDHLDYAGSTRRMIRQDFGRNQMALGDQATNNFAFPKGRVSAAAKWSIGGLARSARGINQGINLEDTDLNCLHANPIYSCQGLEAPLDAIRLATREKGWLIFYTHDLSETPSEFGCTPDDFRSVLDAVKQADLSVFRVQDVMQR